MVSTGHQDSEKPTVRRLHALPSPCKSCGVEATVLYTTHALIPESTILLPAVGVGRKGQQPMTIGAGVEAHLLCFHCGRKEHWTPNGKEWESTLVDDGMALTLGNSHDAAASG